jgi:SSS family solute:Na+ symporter
MSNIHYRGLLTLDKAILVGYAIFVVFSSCRIALKKKEQSSEAQGVADDFVFFGKKANKIIVAISLVSGLLSGVTFLGLPAYTYANGSGMAFTAIGTVVGNYVASKLTLPFFSKLKLKTPYEYIELRFGYFLRVTCALCFCFRSSLYIAVVMQAPAKILYILCGMQPWLTCLICIAFSTIITAKGGMGVVVYTDFIQSIALVIGVIFSLCLAIISLDEVNKADAPLNFRLHGGKFFSITNLSGDNFWFFIIGNSYAQLMYGTDQIAVQRLLSTKNLSSAQFANNITGVLSAILVILCSLLGVYINMFYKLKKVQPLINDTQYGSDDILLLFLLDKAPDGIVGIIVAAVMGCTLSVTCGNLNSAVTCFYVDVMHNKQVYSFRNISFYASLSFGLLSGVLAIGATYINLNMINFVNIILGLLMGPSSAVILLGMVSIRVNNGGMRLGFIFAILYTIYVLVAKLSCSQSTGILEGECNKLFVLGNVNSFIIALFLAMFTSIVAIVGSLIYPPLPYDSLKHLTIWSDVQHAMQSYDLEKKCTIEENEYLILS